jgi:hypothetical protein
MKLYILTSILFLLQLGDWETTRIILRKGRELNPVMSWCFDRIGIDATLLIKVVVVTALGYFAGTQNIRIEFILDLFYVWVVWHNWRQL